MMSLFSSFDLGIYYFSFLFIYFLMYFLLIMSMKGQNGVIMQVLMKGFSKFMESLKPKNYSKFSWLMLWSMFTMIYYMNFSSILPMIYPHSSSVAKMLGISLLMWFTINLFNLIKNKKGLMFHFVPEGSPMILIPFLFLIEIISNLIRPMTLSIRIIANIMAGHLLMILLSKIVLTNPITFGFFYLILNIVEFFVSLIQAYIFVTMILLYHAEI